VKPLIKIFPDLDSLSKAAAAGIKRISKSAIQDNGRFALALSGGRTPNVLYSLLADEYQGQIDWDVTHIFWGDERFVAKDHPESNFKMADEAMISRLSIPRKNIHPISTEHTSPEAAARAYERELCGFFNIADRERSGYKTFDLVLLGVGEDGHTASLFPGDHSSEESNRLVEAVKAPPPYKTRQRITLTLLALNSAKDVYFLVSGSKKRDVLKSILSEPSVEVYPAAMVRPRGKVIWFLDEEVSVDNYC
jgi:6-phosphogluconolactonase